MTNLNRPYDLPGALRVSFDNFPNNKSLNFVDGETLSYSELKVKVETLAAQLQAMGIGKNSKVAILSPNMPNWGISYFAITFTGAVVVPILPDFSQKEIANIIEHAEVKTIFISKQLCTKFESFIDLRKILIEDFTESCNNSESIALPQVSDKDFKEVEINENDMLSLIYTSGATGASKGVMLSHKNIVWNAIKARTMQYIDDKDIFLSMLPLSHTFENTCGFIFPMLHGASVWYLSKAPTPQVLQSALKTVKPTIMISVPLIIEKIYKGTILKKFNANPISKALYKFRPTRKILSIIAGKKLKDTFGGNLKFLGVGGAKLDKDCELFLRDANFPLAIGYGLTETSPLLAGATMSTNLKYQSTGYPLEGVQLRIADANKKTGEGEIQAKGENIMLGYYNAPEMTSEVFTEDGWFKTGDLGKFKGTCLYIKGRLKNMILGASGENIYPEEIESLINNKEFVLESLVLQKKGKLVAMVYLNIEELEEKYKQLKEDLNVQIDEILREIQTSINAEVSKFSRLQMVMLQPTPFEKTPTLKIKRFLYS